MASFTQTFLSAAFATGCLALLPTQLLSIQALQSAHAVQTTQSTQTTPVAQASQTSKTSCEAIAKAQKVAADPKYTYAEVLIELCGRLKTELGSNPQYAQAFEPLFKESIAWLENKPNRLVSIYAQVIELGTETYDLDDLGAINKHRAELKSQKDQLASKTGLLKFMAEKILTLGDGPNEIGLFERVLLTPENSLAVLKGQYDMADRNPASHQTVAPSDPSLKNARPTQMAMAQTGTSDVPLNQSPAPDLVASPSPLSEQGVESGAGSGAGADAGFLSGSIGTYLNLGISGLLLALLIYALISISRLKAQLAEYQEDLSKMVLPQQKREILSTLKQDNLKPLENIITQLRQRVKEQGDALELLQPRPKATAGFAAALELSDDQDLTTPAQTNNPQQSPEESGPEAAEIIRAYLANPQQALEIYPAENLKPSKSNQMERRNNADLALELEPAGTSSQAFYFGFALADDHYAVVPSLQHTYNAILLSLQGLEKIYQIETVSGSEKGKILDITRPALMQKQGESWQLLEKGNLWLSA